MLRQTPHNERALMALPPYAKEHEWKLDESSLPDPSTAANAMGTDKYILIRGTAIKENRPITIALVDSDTAPNRIDDIEKMVNKMGDDDTLKVVFSMAPIEKLDSERLKNKVAENPSTLTLLFNPPAHVAFNKYRRATEDEVKEVLEAGLRLPSVSTMDVAIVRLGYKEGDYLVVSELVPGESRRSDRIVRVTKIY